MLFVVTDNYSRSMLTGESSILCLVEGTQSPVDLLKTHAQRVKDEEKRRTIFYASYSYSELKPKLPPKKWWQSHYSYHESAAMTQWRDKMTDYYDRFGEHCATYQPQDKVEEIPEYLQKNGYKLIDHEIL